jgi:hypothetical protein
MNAQSGVDEVNERQMTLEEWVGQLFRDHDAAFEYRALINELNTYRKLMSDLKMARSNYYNYTNVCDMPSYQEAMSLYDKLNKENK